MQEEGEEGMGEHDGSDNESTTSSLYSVGGTRIATRAERKRAFEAGEWIPLETGSSIESPARRSRARRAAAAAAGVVVDGSGGSAEMASTVGKVCHVFFLWGGGLCV
jgi:hypothetical protein